MRVEKACSRTGLVERSHTRALFLLSDIVVEALVMSLLDMKGSLSIGGERAAAS
jgi:hypothetical protein